MKNTIQFVDNRRKNEIDTLRMHAYHNASGFAVDLSTLTWRASDDESFIIIAESENQIVSTMRGEVIETLSLLESKLECPWDFPLTLDMPCLLLSRAATLTSHRAHGFNLVLRYWFLRFAIQKGIRFMIGTFISGSPREKSLHEMGYHFFENKLGWQQSTYRSLSPVTIAVLDLKNNAEKALQYCLDRVGQRILEFPFHGKIPELRFARSM